MKRYLILTISLLTLNTFAYAGPVCQQKEQAIQKEIDVARQHGNAHRLSGLERALSETRANCSDEDVLKAHREKIEQHQKKVAERERELRQEKDEGGDSKKIAKRERKLAEAQRELKDVQAAPY